MLSYSEKFVYFVQLFALHCVYFELNRTLKEPPKHKNTKEQEREIFLIISNKIKLKFNAWIK